MKDLPHPRIGNIGSLPAVLGWRARGAIGNVLFKQHRFGEVPPSDEFTEVFLKRVILEAFPLEPFSLKGDVMELKILGAFHFVRKKAKALFCWEGILSRRERQARS